MERDNKKLAVLTSIFGAIITVIGLGYIIAPAKYERNITRIEDETKIFLERLKSRIENFLKRNNA